MNCKTRIVAVSFPEISDQVGLKDNFLKKLKEFELTFDQLRTGDIKCLKGGWSKPDFRKKAAPVVHGLKNRVSQSKTSVPKVKFLEVD